MLSRASRAGFSAALARVLAEANSTTAAAAMISTESVAREDK
jgi:hypothetical protein